ncbi:MAG: SUMF1/EgtB/PvdO family nonheme iron enzyme [Bryobacteraceae bacterium]|nr:SUMF1/EgtB/PvdO family nonheme iron enzyme [Bryobacteraceae bacterium]
MRSRTDDLFDLISERVLLERPVPERHRLIFYLGHLEAFDWNLMCRRGLGLESFHAEFDRLFEFGIDPPKGQQPVDMPSDWPAVEFVCKYNAKVRQLIDDVLDRVPDPLFDVAVEHRLMHAETLCYLLHNLALGLKRKPVDVSYRTTGAVPVAEWRTVPGGIATLGKRRSEGFGWDNEFPERLVQVPEFTIRRHKITNAEYLEFVDAGNPAPRFWTRRDGQWFWRGMFEEIPLPLNWPVWTTQEQASRFAAWKGARLPTEAEYHRAAEGSPTLIPARSADFATWDPIPVDAEAETSSAHGVEQLAGNGWEWTETVFGPFPGFEPFSFYPGYSADFFDEAHYVMKGASPRTAACFLRRSFRNWFRTDYPYAFAGFRLAKAD